MIKISPIEHLPSDRLIRFFINHLNRIYCAKSHLRERLPEIIEHSQFSDLASVITETLDDVEKQLLRMDEIYRLMHIDHDFGKCQGMVGLIEDTYDAIHEERDKPELRDLSILFYMQNIESIQTASYKMLKMAAVKIGDNAISQLLKDNFDEATVDLKLFQHLAEQYFE